MKKNMGTIDRGIRTIAAMVIAVLLVTGELTGTLGIVLGVFAVAFVLTSAIGFSPEYLAFKISTRKETP